MSVYIIALFSPSILRGLLFILITGMGQQFPLMSRRADIHSSYMNPQLRDASLE